MGQAASWSRPNKSHLDCFLMLKEFSSDMSISEDKMPQADPGLGMRN